MKGNANIFLLICICNIAFQQQAIVNCAKDDNDTLPSESAGSEHDHQQKPHAAVSGLANLRSLVSDENEEKRPIGGIFTREHLTPNWTKITKKSIAAAESVGNILTDKHRKEIRAEAARKKLLAEFEALKSSGKLKKIGTVGELFIYPVKSFKANKVSEFFAGSRGAVWNGQIDRQFMVVDAENGNAYIRCKNYPKMVLIKAEHDQGKLNVHFPDDLEKMVVVDLSEVITKGDLRETTFEFNGLRQSGYDCGDEIGHALKKYLKHNGLRLIYFAQNDEGKWPMTERDLPTKYYQQNNPNYYKWNNKNAQKPPQVNDKANYQDESAFMMLTAASVDNLKKKLLNAGLKLNVSALNFRPNLVIKTDQPTPHQEDHWRFMQAGKAIFAIYKPCIRCIAININPETGEREAGAQPLAFLKTIRDSPLIKYPGSPAFGVNMAIVQPGNVEEHDPVYIVETAEAEEVGHSGSTSSSGNAEGNAIVEN